MRRRGLKSQTTNYKSQIHQRGYMMITLMLTLALIMLALLAVLPDIRQQVRRDREEELRHRGNSYLRAIQHFYKKFGRYPARVEELENTNNLRFLRKRYTDPINVDPVTGKEKNFKFLTQQDITLNSGPVLGPTAGQMGSGTQSIFGGAQNAPQTPFSSPQGAFGSLGAQPGGQQPTASGAQTTGSGDAGSSAPGNSSSGNSNASDNSNSAGSSTSNSNSGSGLNGPTFGGGPILGVASTSKAKSIRVFFKKDHYNDWLFIYLPMADRGGLLNGPIDPGAQTAGLTPGLPPGLPGQMPGGAPGQGGFGTGFGQGLSPNGGPTQGPQTPTPPQTPQQ